MNYRPFFFLIPRDVYVSCQGKTTLYTFVTLVYSYHHILLTIVIWHRWTIGYVGETRFVIFRWTTQALEDTYFIFYCYHNIVTKFPHILFFIVTIILLRSFHRQWLIFRCTTQALKDTYFIFYCYHNIAMKFSPPMTNL